VLLALINTFVVKATCQYFRDENELQEQVDDEEKSRLSDSTSNTAGDDEADGGFSARIHPAPVLFTDTFRWMLRQENGLPSSSRALFSEANEMGLPEATAVPYDDTIDGSAIDEGQYVAAGDDSVAKASTSDSTLADSKSTLSRMSARRLYGESEKRSPTIARKSDGSLTPRRTSKMESQSVRSQRSDSQRSARNEAYSMAGSSVGGSVSRSVRSTDRSSTTSGDSPTEMFEEEMTLEDGQTEYEEIDDDEQYRADAAANGAESEYAEETVDDYEEYTVKTMSDIQEEEFYEDYSEIDSRSEAHQMI